MTGDTIITRGRLDRALLVQCACPALVALGAVDVGRAVKARTPTSAEMDRVAGTNNYGRKVLRRWRQEAGPLTATRRDDSDRT